MSPPAGTHLVLERDGSLWAVPGSAVERLVREEGQLTVRLAATPAAALLADRLLAVASDLAVWPPPAALARFWPEPAAGLALYGRRPVVVIDPARPPLTLAADGDSGGS
jgi:hypothetical protein